MSKLTKTKMVLTHLRSGQTITSLEAINLFRATRLSAIIFCLRERGYHIATVPTTVLDKFGNTVTYAKYKLLQYNKSESENDLFSQELDVEDFPKEINSPTPIEELPSFIKANYNNNQSFFQKLWSKITSGE